MSAPQTSYTEQLVALAGMLHGIDNTFETGVNDAGTTRQRDTITIDVAADQTYSFTVDGIVVSFVRANAEDVTGIRNALIEAFRAIQSLEGVAFSNPTGVDALTIDAANPGTAIVTANLAANMTLVNTTPNTALEPIPFGLGVVRRSGGTNKSVTLPTLGGQNFRGFVSYDHSVVDPSNAGAAAEASPGQNLSLLRKGYIWVPFVNGAGGTPTEGEDVFLIFSGANAGKISNDQGGVRQVIVITVSTATNDGVYEVELDGRIAQFTADGGATVLEVATGLAAKCLGIAEGGFEVASDATTVTITSDKPITFAEIADPGTDIAIAQTVVASAEVAAELKGIQFRRVDTATLLALVEVNLPA